MVFLAMQWPELQESFQAVLPRGTLGCRQVTDLPSPKVTTTHGY